MSSSSSLLRCPVGGQTRAVPAVPGALLLALAVPFSPWLILHAYGLWLRPHYQFFPLVLLGAGALAYRELKSPGVVGAPSRMGTMLLTLAGLLLLAAIGLFSPWAGAVAALLAVAGAVRLIGGAPLAARLRPAWLFLWLAIPLPAGLDSQLIIGLKQLTVWCSSRALDLVGVVHLLSGHIIEVPGKRLLVEEACSGVHSLFAVLSCTLFLILWTRTPIARAIFLLLAAIGWVLVANVVRVTVIAVLFTRRGIDVSEGWRHEVLGWIIVAATVGLIVSTTRLLLFVVGPPAVAPSTPAETDSGTRLAPLVRQRLAGWLPLACGLFGAVELLVLAPYFSDHLTTLSPRPIIQALDALEAEALPEKVSSWERVGFASRHRTIDDHNFGDYSHIWTYRSGLTTASVSVDYPFLGWHDLTLCYQNVGWTMTRRNSWPTRATDDVGDGVCVEAQFEKPLGEHSHLLFGLVDRAGRFALPPPEEAAPSLGDRFLFRLTEPAARWQRLLGRGSDLPRPEEPLYQIQVYVESGAPPTEVERAQVEELFRQVSRRLRQAAPERP